MTLKKEIRQELITNVVHSACSQVLEDFWEAMDLELTFEVEAGRLTNEDITVEVTDFLSKQSTKISKHLTQELEVIMKKIAKTEKVDW